MRKAEKIFIDTKKACKLHIKEWGYTENESFSKLSTEEVITKKNVADIKDLIEKEENKIKLSVRLQVISKEEALKEFDVLKMVESTLKNHINR